MNDTTTSVLHTLPLSRWARRFERGTVEASGRLEAPLAATAGSMSLHLRAGELAVWLSFEGGEEPRLIEAEVCSEGLRVDVDGDRSCVGDELQLAPGRACLDGLELGAGPEVLESVLGTVFDRIASLSFVATAMPAGELVVRLPAGVQVSLDGREEVTVSGTSDGPPEALRLCAPLEVRCGGEGIRLSHRQFQRLARLAGVRISAATLHPDGEVALFGGASGALDGAVRRGLRSTSSRLSRLVRTSPHFRKLRTFLAHARES